MQISHKLIVFVKFYINLYHNKNAPTSLYKIFAVYDYIISLFVQMILTNRRSARDHVTFKYFKTNSRQYIGSILSIPSTLDSHLLLAQITVHVIKTQQYYYNHY